MLAPAKPIAELTEKEWDAQLFNSQKGLATMLGWTLVYHTYRSTKSQSGFPDRVLVRDRVIFAELKTETGKPSERQRAWLTGLAKSGAEAYLWRPSDLDEIGRILGQRWWRFNGYHRWSEGTVQLGCLEPLAGPVWVPGSLWLPDGHRADTTTERSTA